MKLLTNHIGYETFGPKQAVIVTKEEAIPFHEAQLFCAKTQQLIARFSIAKAQKVARWHQGWFHVVDFSHHTQSGSYYLALDQIRSAPFTIETGLLMQRSFSDLIHYFKSQRCSGIFERQDHQVPLLDTRETKDVHGGWYDASGDVSKYFSHLSYANYMNPQQTPIVVWNLLKSLSLLQGHPSFTAFMQLRTQEEALYGADFLYRMLDKDGFFYTTVFDQWSKDTQRREICAYATQQGNKSADYQAAFRQGAGVAIAALAQASALKPQGEFSAQQYLTAAQTAYQHLAFHNLNYLDDGQENIIDEYCALLASCALYSRTQDSYYLEQARDWTQRLSQRQQSDEQFTHFWAANSDGSRPYFHAAEAGLPAIALMEYLSIEKDETLRKSVQTVLHNACQFELTITQEVDNPFSYPRQYVKSVQGAKRSSFFIAQNNETGYWWQGENARLASLATMGYLAQTQVQDPKLKQDLLVWSQASLNWILGLNPYDMCMLDGHGHNNPDYLPDLGFFNAKGGICNGITAGFDDEEDIAFNPEPQAQDMLQNWRWGEQWIPHGAWYLLAVASQFAHFSQPEVN